jgi:GMP synthase (glutamine-hydrolysing)
LAEPVLVVRHVPWEGPHRIADALIAAGLVIDERRPLEGDSLPALEAVSAAVFMGGPMNVDEVDRYPGLADEREWLAAAVAAGLPVLGVCLGSQLLARALGSEVRPGASAEIGWAPIEVFDASDPVVGGLAPSTTVLHWHGDVFDLPDGAELLASSERTEVQAFRAGNAWGTLFHAEADAALLERWLAEPTMAAEAPDGVIEDAVEFEGPLVTRSATGFANFAALALDRD